MTPKKKRRACSEAPSSSKEKDKDKAQDKAEAKREQKHLQLLNELELDLTVSCCEICHCDCYSSHSSSNVSGRGAPQESPPPQQQLDELRQLEHEIAALEELQRQESKLCSKQRKRRASSSKSPPVVIQAQVHSRRNSGECVSRRSKSAGSGRSSSEPRQPDRSPSVGLPQEATGKRPKRRGGARDCTILQTLLGSLEDAPMPLQALSISGKAKSKSQQSLNRQTDKDNLALVPLSRSHGQGNDLQPLCASMANLCLAPTVRAAYQHVPSHDKKILNRMAVKRSQQAMDKEHAWLARKYWENERLERELYKCEQVEEYKRAVHDKQFQDYLVTKARLQALAQRDLDELRRLRESLNAKDEAAKQRIEALRLERDIQLCQRRYEELRRSEAVNVQQEGQQLDEKLRKRDACMRLTQRLRRAGELRGQMLDAYLRRLQHDNYVEQLQHEEHWRERQQFELLKREQLKADIQRKGRQSQRFVECRQRRHEAITRTAKISASLRELVRQSVTPEAGVLNQDEPQAGNSYAQHQAQLGRLLFEQPPRALEK